MPATHLRPPSAVALRIKILHTERFSLERLLINNYNKNTRNVGSTIVQIGINTLQAVNDTKFAVLDRSVSSLSGMATVPAVNEPGLGMILRKSSHKHHVSAGGSHLTTLGTSQARELTREMPWDYSYRQAILDCRARHRSPSLMIAMNDLPTYEAGSGVYLHDLALPTQGCAILQVNHAMDGLTVACWDLGHGVAADGDA